MDTLKQALDKIWVWMADHPEPTATVIIVILSVSLMIWGIFVWQ